MSELSVLGFSSIAIAAPDGSPLNAEGITAAINAAAGERGLEVTASGSDAFDASRDVIIAEAVAAAGGGEYRIVDGELWVTVPGFDLEQFLP